MPISVRSACTQGQYDGAPPVSHARPQIASMPGLGAAVSDRLGHACLTYAGLARDQEQVTPPGPGGGKCAIQLGQFSPTVDKRNPACTQVHFVFVHASSAQV